jgi:hypothetical protein
VLSVICTLFLCIHTNIQGIRHHLKKYKYGGSCKNYNGALNVICKFKSKVCVINQVLVGKITIDNFLLNAKTISICELPVNSFTVKNLKICPCCLWYRYITVMCLKLNQLRNKNLKVHHCLIESPKNNLTLKNVKMCERCLCYRYTTVMCRELNQRRNKNKNDQPCRFIESQYMNYETYNLIGKKIVISGTVSLFLTIWVVKNKPGIQVIKITRV